MNEEQTPKEQTDEIGDTLESGNEVNEAIEQEGEDAATGILRDTDAAKQEQKKESENQDLQGAP
ncbi:hypothetical protein AB6735_03495 [Mucilaginibacter sp. RCC_168]|uniref:hypothetical protein n=1 Tax=Mucilaginibacter sp. RCC_168 TaxID=3239221 RepID=UPI0035257DFB